MSRQHPPVGLGVVPPWGRGEGPFRAVGISPRGWGVSPLGGWGIPFRVRVIVSSGNATRCFDLLN